MAGKTEKTERDIVLQELRTLIKKLPQEGLRFLLEQAKVIEYNMKVDELNRTRETLRSRGGESTAGKGQIRIEKGQFGGGLFLVIKDQRKIMDPEEISALAYIAKKAKTVKEGAAGLYRWFERERDDVLMDAVIGKGDPALEELCSYLRSFDKS